MSTNAIRTLLIVEDNPGDARLLREMLRDDNWQNVDMVFAATMVEAERHLAAHAFDIILLDLVLPDAQGITAIKRTRAAAPFVPLVVLTGMDDEAVASQSLQEGAQDFLIKGQIESRGLVRALRYATERKRLERLKDEFVSTVSHELRTPVTSIAASLGLLMAQACGSLPESISRLIVIAHTNSQRVVRLVNDILDIEKLEARQIEFDFKRIEVQPLVEQAVDANQDLAQSNGVRIRLEHSDARALDTVRADADRLTQVVTNLLTNAIKYSPPGQDVVVTIAQEDNLVRISVRDYGPGIPAHFKSHVFERFAQADATNARSKSGTGLGLSIVKQIVSRLGGKVDFHDAAGGGTVFAVELPSWERSVELEYIKQLKAEAEDSLQSLVQTARYRTEIAAANALGRGAA